MEELKAKRDDLTRKLRREEDRGLERLSEIQVWLNEVDNVEQKVNDLFSDRDVQLQRLCLCGFCSKKLKSGYYYGKKVFLMLREVEGLKTRDFDVIADQAQTSEVQERPLPRIIVGQETMVDDAWKHLIEDEAGIMGVYGMGGVGKTTILTQINNKFSNDRCGFDFVIWVVVSKELHIEKIQDEIAQKVGLGGEEWNQKDKSQKGLHLYNFLKTKRFVLFLDDIWETVELDRIGIPDPTSHNGWRLAFTTRSLNVCTSMGVEEPMEVQCLADDDAFDLFKRKVGQITLGSDPEIPDLAKIVAKKCCGLPLALNVIGDTMSSKRTIQEWRRAIHVLNSYAAEFSGMEDKILPLLKYSYDSLNGENVKLCLLYCALYPEDAKIPLEDLIGYWICEGIIDRSESVEEAENMGYEIIGSLVCASLLMKGFDQDGEAVVYMHDVVREMALWIASALGKEKDGFIVREGVWLHEMSNVKKWNVVRRMSLMNNKILCLTGSPKFTELTTLLLQKGKLTNISGTFFKSMPKLVVLDLSGNHYLSELPEEISELISLRCLNLSDSGIISLPNGLQKLKKLIHLDLDKTTCLGNIDGISNLHNLKVLKLYGSGFHWNTTLVKELEALEHLEVLTITIYYVSTVHHFDTRELEEIESFEDFDRVIYSADCERPEQFLTSHRLMSCTRFLKINYTTKLESSGISLPLTMDKLRKFSIDSCIIPEIKMGRKCSFLSLVKVDINTCKGLRELTFLMFAPNLKNLRVWDAKDLEDIINKEKACEVEESWFVPFQKLNELSLRFLPKLENIYWSPLPFPCLEEIYVSDCPNLKRFQKWQER